MCDFPQPRQGHGRSAKCGGMSWFSTCSLNQCNVVPKSNGRGKVCSCEICFFVGDHGVEVPKLVFTIRKYFIELLRRSAEVPHVPDGNRPGDFEQEYEDRYSQVRVGKREWRRHKKSNCRTPFCFMIFNRLVAFSREPIPRRVFSTLSISGVPKTKFHHTLVAYSMHLLIFLCEVLRRVLPCPHF